MCSMLFCSSTGANRVLLFHGNPPSVGGSFPEKSLTLASFRRLWKKSGSQIPSKRLSAELSVTEEEWLKKLPEKKKPLYSHSLPCIEAWLKKLGFCQSSTDCAVWFIERLDWHAQISLDVTDLCIRYLKIGPGNLEKDMERRFSYALSREDIENAILGGP